MQAIGEVEGALDEDVAGALTPGDTIRVRGEVSMHPLHQADVVLRSFLQAAPARANVIDALRGMLELRFGAHLSSDAAPDSEPLEFLIPA